MAARGYVALDTVILGEHGEIQAGQALPATYQDIYGTTHQTDFKHLVAAGYAGPAPEQTKDELLEQARELDVEGRSQMDKDELAKAVAKAAKKTGT